MKTKKLLKNMKNGYTIRSARIKASQKEADEKELNFVRTQKEFKDMVLSSVEKFSMILGVNVNKIFFKKMKTRWGSCSSKRNININKYLMYLPSYLIEYVVFHEVAHLVEMGHNKRFWKIIEQKYPDYKDMEDELLLYWLLIRKLIDGESMLKI